MRGRPAFKSRLIGLGKRCEVTAYTPTLEMQNIADERTAGMVDYYVEMSRHRTDFSTRLQDLDTLARSCYMQGINDILDAIRNGYAIPKD